MSRGLRGVIAAFAYFSTIPMGRFAAGPPPDAFALSFLPLVGAVIGALSGAAGVLVSLRFVQPWPALAVFLGSLLLTGALHVDGFLDCCDALLVPASPARRREILNDPRHGTFALAGMAALAATWIAALATMPPSRLILACAFAATLARLVAIPNAWLAPYGAGGSFTKSFERRPSVAIMLVLAALLLVAAWRWMPVALIAAPLALVFSLLFARWAAGRLDGLGGDVYGCIVVLAETGLLAAFALTSSAGTR